MLPALDALRHLQQLDTAADAARKRLGELPLAEQTIEARISGATTIVDDVKARIQANQQSRRALEKDVAAVDARMARFNDHKAAVKTNQEYQALTHEIATAKTEKDAIEEQILVLMEAADGLATELKGAEAALVDVRREGDRARAALAQERTALTAEIDHLAHDRGIAARDLQAPLVARYDQLLKQRRGLAVAEMKSEICSACHVRLRPHIAQQVRRNDSIVQCESCQRILYYLGPPPDGAA